MVGIGSCCDNREASHKIKSITLIHTYICNSPYADKKCSKLPPPDGGDRACDVWMFGRFCSPLCKNNTDFAQTLLQNLWVCGASGIWFPNNRFPDCSSKLTIPFSFKL